MPRDFPESDWKIFRKHRELALDRFCERVIAEIAALAAKSGKSSHERYLEIFRLLKQRNEVLSDCLDDVRRSTAVTQLARIRHHELLTAEEFAQFSPETRAAVESLLEIWRG
jgi:hypothetical protein